MNLGREFIQAASDSTLKPNVVVVFSPEGQNFTTIESNKPNSNTTFDGSGSVIFWKHEPDSISDAIKAKFANHLDKTIGDEVPLACIDSVSISGSEIDLKDASVSSDEVVLNVVLNDIKDKSFFNKLIGYNVEIYFGFATGDYDFSDYERFYFGRFNGLSSSENLTLTLKIGTKADYWNSSWRHSQGLVNKKLAYDYPLPDSFNAIGHQNDFQVPQPPEAYFRFGIQVFDDPDSKKYAFRYRDGYLPVDLTLEFPRIGRTFHPYFNIFKPMELTSAFIFSPSGKPEQIKEVQPELFDKFNVGIYPELDKNFVAASGSERIRFKIRDTIIESKYTDTYIMFPRVLALVDPIFYNLLTRYPQLFANNPSPPGFYAWMFMEITRLPNVNPQDIMSTSLDKFRQDLVNNDHSNLDPSNRGAFVGGHFVWVLNDLESRTYDFDTNRYVYTENTDDKYNLNSLSLNFGAMCRFEFATQLYFYKSQDFELDNNFVPPKKVYEDFKAEAGDEVIFYDTITGIGKLDYILVNSLNKNLGVDLNLIDQTSFITARFDYEVAVGSSRQSDFSHNGVGEGKTLIEDKILKSNNLRIIHDGGILKCIYLGFENKPFLPDADGNPFLIYEDDLIEPVVYETREDDHLKKLKINIGFKDLDDDSPGVSFFAVDGRSADGQTGQITVTQDILFEGNEEDFEEIDLYQNLTYNSQTRNVLDDEPFGFLGRRGLFGGVGDGLGTLSSTRLIKNAVEQFANDYFKVLNPSIKMTLITGPKGLQVNVGDIITVRDHDAFELFGSQFVKVLITSKSISDWGTSNIQVTLDCLFVETSEDYLSVVKDITPPKNLRLVSKTRNRAEPNGLTDLVIEWDAPDEWGVDKDSSKKYMFKEITTLGPKSLFGNLPIVGSISGSKFTYSPGRLSFTIENGSTHHYQVTADNTVQESKGSNVLTVEAFGSVQAPSAPLNLRATASPDNPRRVSLIWDEPSDNGGDANLSYQVFLDGNLARSLGGALNYTYDFTSGGRYCFSVRASNSAGISPLSNQVCLTLESPPEPPVGNIFLSVNALTENSIGVNWQTQFISGSSGVYYEVYRDGALVTTTTDLSFIDTGLEPGTEYCYVVSVLNAGGLGFESDRQCVTTLAQVFFSVPGIVQNLTDTSTTKTGISVSWSVPLDNGGRPITGYKVAISTDNTTFNYVSQTTLNKDFASLSPGTNYFIKVLAYNEVGDGLPVLLEVATVPGAIINPRKPTLTARQTEFETPFEVLLTATIPDFNDDFVTSVIFQRSTDNVTFVDRAYHLAPNASSAVRDTQALVKNQTYYYRARTVNEVGNSQFSDVVSVEIVDCTERDAVVSDTNLRFKDATAHQKQTNTFIIYNRKTNVDGEGTDDPCGSWKPSPPNPLSKVRNLRLVEARETEADIAWDIPYFLGGYAIREYQILLAGVTTSVNSTDATLTGLNAGTLYHVQVRAVNAFGSVGPWVSLRFTTAAAPAPPAPMLPGAPTNLRIDSSHSEISKTFAWDAPSDLGNPELTHYQLHLATSANNSSYFDTVDARLQLRIDNLLYNEPYTAWVFAVNANGKSVSSARFTFTTGAGRPTPPRNIRLSVVNDTSVKVDWDAPQTPNGVIAGYNIYFRELLSGASWRNVRVGNVLTHKITNFERGKTYEFDMTASTSAGASPLTNSPVTITIPDYEKPSAAGLACSLENNNIILTPTLPTDNGGAALYRYRFKVSVPGVSAPRFFYKDNLTATPLIVNQDILTTFGISTLPTGTYNFELTVRNAQLDEYSDATSASRCSLNYTAPATRAKPVTDITLSKTATKIICGYTLPVDSGNYQFSISIRATNNVDGSRYINNYFGYGNVSVNPNGEKSSQSMDIPQGMGDPFDNRTFVVTITSRKRGVTQTASFTKTQVYELVVRIPNPPNFTSLFLYSDNIPRVRFNYPSGKEPITSFRVYEVGSDNVGRLVQTIPNTYAKDQRRIIVKVGTQTYTLAGTYTFYMTSVNSAGESESSPQRSFEVLAPDDPRVPRVPNAPVISNLRRGSRFANDNLVYCTITAPTGIHTPNRYKLYVGTSESNLVLKRTIEADLISTPAPFSTTENFDTPGTTYYFAVKARNGQGDSEFSNVLSLSTAALPKVPNAPHLRRVTSDTNKRAVITYDFPSMGPAPTHIKFYRRAGTVDTLIATVNASPFTVGQTSITYHSLVDISAAGTYSFFAKATNAVGDSNDSNVVSITVAAPTPPTPTEFDVTITRIEKVGSGWRAHFTTRSGFRVTNELLRGTRARVHLIRNARTNFANQTNFFPYGEVPTGVPTGASFNNPQNSESAVNNGYFDFSLPRNPSAPSYNRGYNTRLANKYDYRMYLYKPFGTRVSFDNTNATFNTSASSLDTTFGLPSPPAGNYMARLSYDPTHITADLRMRYNCFGFKLNLYDVTAGANVFLGNLYRYFYYLLGASDFETYNLPFSLDDNNFGYPLIGTLNIADFKRRIRTGRTIQGTITFFGDSGQTENTNRVTMRVPTN